MFKYDEIISGLEVKLIAAEKAALKDKESSQMFKELALQTGSHGDE